MEKTHTKEEVDAAATAAIDRIQAVVREELGKLENEYDLAFHWGEISQHGTGDIEVEIHFL